MSEDDSGLGLKVHEDAYRELEQERDEWKAKYIKQNKDLGCEMMDPAGTIWDYASGLQRESVQLKREVEGWMAAAKQWRENAIKLHEQRDRLAEALRELCETLLKDKPRDITDLLNKAGDALEAVKGGSDE
jgi:predicted  nucleic acid-binding Zn-ribbon protein